MVRYCERSEAILINGRNGSHIMELRKEIELQFDVAEERYPLVLQLISDYTDYCDENGDEDETEYKKLEEKLHQLTGKDMSQYNLWEWWEEDGIEILAFNISLPQPQIVPGITIEELTEIVTRMKTFVEPEDDSFKSLFYNETVFGTYFPQFLKQNFKTYDIKLFQSHKGKDGSYFEYSIEQVVDKLWNNGNF